MKWQCLDTGCNSAAANMALDAELLSSLENNPQPLLHFYDWDTSAATYGCFVDPAQFLDLNIARKWGLDLAKRPTGGGVIFHMYDFAFSVLVPASHPKFSHEPLNNYHFVNEIVATAIHHMSGKLPDLLFDEGKSTDASCKRFCMARPTKYDLMIQGRKVGGAAQRKTRYGYLHQASISLVKPREDFVNEILLDKRVVTEGMKRTTYPLLGEDSSKVSLEEARQELRLHLRAAFSIG